jgi:hypothetical protein
LAALSLTACGGGHGPDRGVSVPRPAESVAQGASRSIDLATRAGCRETRSIFHSSVPRLSSKDCNAQFAVLRGAAPGSVTRYGTGGLAVYPRIGIVVLALDRDRRFRVAVVVRDARGAGLGGTSGSDRAAAHAVQSISKGSCRDSDPVFGTYKHQCARRSLKALGADLHGEVPSATRLGGDYATAFYALRLRNGHVYTLVLFGSPELPGDKWNLLDAYRAQ